MAKLMIRVVVVAVAVVVVVGDMNLSQTLSIVATQSLMLTRRFLKYSQILPPYNKIHKAGGKR